MKTEYFEVSVDGNILRGIKHFSKVNSDIAFLIVHGYFSSNKIGPHRLYVDIANLIADKYGDAYRFDLRGMGESDGDISKVTLNCHVKDVQGVIDYIYSRGIKKLVLIGHCMGADLILQIIKTNEYKFREIIMLAPYFTSSKSLSLFFKEPYQVAELYSRGFTYRNGLYVDRSFFLEESFFENFLNSINSSNSFINVIAAKNDQFILFEENEKMRLEAKNINFVYVDDADHNFLKTRSQLFAEISKIFEDNNYTNMEEE